ncbi:hypothetical protein [Aureispira anguillae]|uniref:Uncharacterized protein n=1 Tax=Aureispira anguillae TaxID=2864201 RepID=A0A916DSL3_9BACT|nr:hypothetical protein [Aureispira anguillae]BDS11961.1 hypothetical protein AsAng_0026760 [Aureispira anguillae]
MLLHRLLLFILIGLAIYTTRLDWIYLQEFDIGTTPSWFFMYNRRVLKEVLPFVYTIYVVIGLFILFFPKKPSYRKNGVLLSIFMVFFIIILGAILLYYQSKEDNIAKHSTGFTWFALANGAILIHLFVFLPVAANSNYHDKILDHEIKNE